jgi:hypothetical protein
VILNDSIIDWSICFWYNYDSSSYFLIEGLEVFIMIIYEIIDSNGKRIELIEAESERQALCIYLMNHEELTDMMLWKSADFLGSWKLAEYDNEDDCLMAREAKRY